MNLFKSVKKNLEGAISLFAIILSAILNWQHVINGIQFWISLSIFFTIYLVAILVYKTTEQKSVSLHLPNTYNTNVEDKEKYKYSTKIRILAWLGLLSIAACWFIYFVFIKPNSCQKYSSDFIITIADFEENGDNMFSKKIETNIMTNLEGMAHPIRLKKYTKGEMEIRKTVDSLNSVICNYKGIIVYGDWSKEDSIFDCFISLVNVKDDSVFINISKKNRLYINSPREMPFSIKDQSDLIGNFISGLTNYYKDSINTAIKYFNSYKTYETDKLNIDEKKFYYYSNVFLGNSYIKIRDTVQAMLSYEKAKKLNSKDSLLKELNPCNNILVFYDGDLDSKMIGDGLYTNCVTVKTMNEALEQLDRTCFSSVVIVSSLDVTNKEHIKLKNKIKEIYSINDTKIITKTVWLPMPIYYSYIETLRDPVIDYSNIWNILVKAIKI